MQLSMWLFTYRVMSLSKYCENISKYSYIAIGVTGEELLPADGALRLIPDFMIVIRLLVSH